MTPQEALKIVEDANRRAGEAGDFSLGGMALRLAEADGVPFNLYMDAQKLIGEHVLAMVREYVSAPTERHGETNG